MGRVSYRDGSFFYDDLLLSYGDKRVEAVLLALFFMNWVISFIDYYRI